MELGNMIFGNSRGEFSIPREESFEGPWRELCDELKVNWRGYADEGCLVPEVNGILETAVFAIRSYDWDAECDCGFDARAEAWHRANPHATECYQSIMDARMTDYDLRTEYKEIEALAFGNDKSFFRGMDAQTEPVEVGGVQVGFSSIFTPRTDGEMGRWKKANNARREFEDTERKKLCEERGLSYPDGCAVHCDCYKNAAGQKWFSEHDHTPTCRLVQPNFLYKPTGFRINWYKYPFRDSYMTPGINAKEWYRIVRHCIESLTATEQK